MSDFPPSPQKPDSRPKFLAGKMPIFNNGVFWAATPAMALFALAILVPQAPAGKAPVARSGIISASNWVVAASDTVLVARQSAGKYSTLRGRLEASKGDVIASPASGVVSQVSIRPGQTISAGQQIALMTTGVAPIESRTQMPSPAENLQSRAEAAQVAAAQQQEKLESRMNAANAELQRAKERVAVAQQRVADARQLIARLQKGEQIAAEAPAASTRSTPKANSQNTKSNAGALRESQRLQSVAEAAEADARAAQKAAREAEADAAAKQAKLKTAQAAAKTRAPDGAGSTPGAGEAENNTDSKKETSANTSNAAAVAAAREIAASASSHALDLKREAVRAQTRATQARSKANDAARRATQDLQVFDGDNKTPSAPQSKPKSGGEKMTVPQAVKIARAAMQESDDAIKNAERIQKKVESYGGTVAKTRQKFDSAARQLEAAQQRMWDSAPAMQTRQTPVQSQRSGIVTWVAAPTTVVHRGDAVAAVGRPDRLEVVVEDKTGAWKTLKRDERVLALVDNRKVDNRKAEPQTGGADSGIDGGVRDTGSTPGVAPRPVATLTRGSEGENQINIPTLARVVFIAPPSKPGQAARIRIAVHNPPAGKNNQNGLAPRAFAPGMKVFFSIAQPSKQTAIRIPTASVRRDDKGKTFVAVLAPIENAARDRVVNECRVEWREVFLAPGDGIHNRVKTGLREGERLALRPDSLYDYTLAFGPQATVSVEQI